MASQIQHLGAWGLKDPLHPIRNLLVQWGYPSPALTYLEAGFAHMKTHYSNIDFT